LCCGSAGIFNLLQPDTADQLGSRKVDNLLSTGAEAVASANPGCLLQLIHGLHRRGFKTMPAFHMVELLDASMRGIPREDLLHSDNHRLPRGPDKS
jgi:glycolate oxidase iron-sulfur subunit